MKNCTLPLTGVKCVKKIVSDLAVMEVTDKGLKLLERAPGVSVEDIVKATEARLIAVSYTHLDVYKRQHSISRYP